MTAGEVVDDSGLRISDFEIFRRDAIDDATASLWINAVSKTL